MSLYLGSEKVENVTAQITLPVEPSDDLPLADGTASAGTSKKFSRADHVHPAQEIPVKSVNNKTGAVSLTASDVGAISSTLTGTAGQVLTKTASGQKWADMVSPQPSTTTPLAPTEVGSVGTSTAYARGDHSHPNEVFWCTVTGNDTSGYTCDKTQTEILAAYNAGKVCVAKYGTYMYYLQFAGSEVLNFYNNNASGFDILQFNIYKGINIYEDTFESLFAPQATKVTLTTSGWSNNQQTVTCSGVSSSATSQEIRVMPADASKTSAYVSCGVSCVAQASNKLTFACDKVPTTAIDVYVVMQSLNFQS